MLTKMYYVTVINYNIIYGIHILIYYYNIDNYKKINVKFNDFYSIIITYLYRENNIML